MKTIITIQHTESIHHTNGMVGSWPDWDLSELGKEQAWRIGEKMAKEELDRINQDEREAWLAEKRLEYIRDLHSSEDYGR